MAKFAAVLLCAIAFIIQEARAQEPFTYLKSLEAPDRDPDGIWSPDEIEKPSSMQTGTKSLGAVAEPTVHEFVRDTPDGKLIVSQKWDAACSLQLCETRVVLVKPDGSKEVKVQGEMMPQLDLQRTDGRFKDISVTPQLQLSGDGKSLIFSEDQNSSLTFSME
ncbi:hypothetical protein [Sinorhizobium meliloti]|uniref:hypothetical protein n=1 Tax=Rhizobium meliloti TaxID=382 RepID=UPI000B4A16DB|nr:hypothetical protein [Sinorhizobium meliloti]ASP66426.1 hypothetical protein CDO29_17435 [Sinorhizobium meliloti]MQX03829.1 hypothetical protein [Sinorhizobium meliloti]RVK46518.1 hypothetical protein CN160_21080 [Sinorhizobium meliloti]